MTQRHFRPQPCEGCKVGKNVGMNREVIPTSFPLSEQNVGTAIPTSRAALATRRHSPASGIVSLILLLAYAALALIVYRDHAARAEALGNTLPPTPEEAVKH